MASVRRTPLQAINKNPPDKTAKQLRKRFEITMPPVELDNICSTLGVQVIGEKLDRDGYLLEFPDGTREILCNDYGNSKNLRWRFTIAHEIGHLILNSISKDYEETPKYAPSEKVETWCDSFATELLLPASWIMNYSTEIVRKLKSGQGRRLAEYAGVSVEALRWRIWEVLHLATVVFSENNDEVFIESIIPTVGSLSKDNARNLILKQRHLDELEHANIYGPFTGELDKHHFRILFVSKTFL